MMIKTYLVKSLEEAEKQISQELGPHAVILTSRQIRPKGFSGLFSSTRFEVTAAVEEQDWETFKLMKGSTSFGVPYPPRNHSSSQENKEENLESPLSISTDESLKHLVELRQLLDNNFPLPKEETPSSKEPSLNLVADDKTEQDLLPSDIFSTYRDPRFSRQNMKEETPIAKEPEAAASEPNFAFQFEEMNPSSSNDNSNKTGLKPQEIAALCQNLRREFASSPTSSFSSENPPLFSSTIDITPHHLIVEEATLRKIFREEIDNFQSHATPWFSDSNLLYASSSRFLISKGISPSIALQIEHKLNAQFGSVDLEKPSQERAARLNELKKELASLIKTAGPLTLGQKKPTVVALIGPSGMGKTTTAVKLTWQFQNELGKQAAIVSFDSYQTGSREQIHAFSEKYNFPLAFASNAHELHQALRNFANADVIFIDYAGHSPYHGQQLDELANIFHTIDSLQCYLVMSAATKDVDICGTIQEFTRIPVEALIFTKMDETISHGSLVNTCVKTGLPISYLTNGPAIPEDLKIADPEEITRTILIQNNAKELTAIRELALQ